MYPRRPSIAPNESRTALVPRAAGTAIVPAKPAAASVLDRYPELAAKAKAIIDAGTVANTQRALESDWAGFVAWCGEYEAQPLPATFDTVIGFATERLGTHAYASVRRSLASISKMHDVNGHPSPARDPRVAALLVSYRRGHKVEQAQAAPLTRDLLLRLAVLPQNARDWAILCFGQATACRRSELCAFNLEDVQYTPQGLVVNLRRSKTDQERRGRLIGVRPRDATPSICPVRALSRWIKERGCIPGPLLYGGKGGEGGRRLTDEALNAVVKRAARRLMLDDTLYSGHSLRAGWATDADADGVPEADIMSHLGHVRVETTRKYIRSARDPFRRTK